MQIGLVGLPGSGKTTLFNALVRADADVGGYGGARGPNRGTIQVPDQRISKLSDLFKPKKTTFATVDYLDIAGITPGSGKQEDSSDGGLAGLRNMDVLIHVLQGFESTDQEPPTPGEDFENIELELAVADLDIVEKRLTRIEKEVRLDRSANLAREGELLGECRVLLEKGEALRALNLKPEDEKLLRGYQFLTQKPMLVVLNINEDRIGEEDACLTDLGDLGPEVHPMALCAKVEMEIAQLDEEDAAVFLQDLGIDEPALSRMILTSYKMLSLISFFTVGEDEVRAWTISIGTLAPGAAGEIHSDLERGFIRAETVSCSDLLEAGGWSQARDKGLLRLEGKQYLVQDGDVMNIRFNV